MFAFGAAITAATAIYDAELERHFYETVKTLPVEYQAQVIAEHRALREKQRLEAREDRKHHELCEAIRESGNRSSSSAIFGMSGLGLGMLLGESFHD